MDILLSLFVLFSFGSIGGWATELIYRRFFSSHKWINPGFLVGPYLPLYGFGVTLLFVISYYVNFAEWFGVSAWLNSVLVIVTMSVSMTAIEFIAGIIFIKGMGIKLWDYSDRKGNVKGIICPLFSLIWSAIAVAFYFLAKTPCANLVTWFERKTETNVYMMFLLGMFYGMMLVDLCYSMQVATKIKKFASEHKVVIHYEKIKETIRELQIKTKEKISYVFPLKSDVSLKEHLSKQLSIIKEKAQKLKKKDK